MKKIALITTSFPRSQNDGAAAAGLFVLDLALIFQELGHDVTVIAPQFEGAVENLGVRVERFGQPPLTKPLSNLKLFNPSDLNTVAMLLRSGRSTTLRVADTLKPDLFIALWTLPSGHWASIAKRKFGIPYVTWSLGSEIWTYGKLPIFRTFLKYVLTNSNGNFADGVALTQQVSRLSGQSCKFLPSARNLHLKPEEKKKIPGKKLEFLFLGRFHKNKGIDILAEAMTLLEPNILQKLHFTFCGGGPLESQVRQSVEKSNLSQYVSFTGYVGPTESIRYFRQADYLVIPSRIESIPCVLGDAIQTNTPVIATDVGDMGQVVRDLSLGVVTPPNSPRALANAISSATMTVTTGQYDFAKAEAIFDLSVSAKRLLSTGLGELLQ